MAKLKEIAHLMNINLDLPKEKLTNIKNKPTGKKRRAWISDNKDSVVNLTISQKQNQYDKKTNKHNNKKQGTKWEQTGNKVGTKWEQTGNKVGTEKRETGNKVGTNWEQSGNKTGNKVGTKIPFSSLVGLQRNIVLLIYQECKKSGSKITGSLTLNHIANDVKTREIVAKTTIKRLAKKGVIIRKEFKNGRGGWSKYELPDVIFHELLNIESGNKTGNKVGTTGIHSSSSNIITTTRTEEWEKIDVDRLAEIGFSKNHLSQLLERNSPEIVQESINHFAYGMKHNKKSYEKYTDPINVLMGVLRKGEAWFEANYRSPQEIAQKKLLEQKKTEMKRREKLLEESYDLAFNEWRSNLPVNETEAIAPKSKSGIMGGLAPQKARLSAYFKKNIWPDRKLNYLTEEFSTSETI